MIASELPHSSPHSMARVYALMGGAAIVILAALGFLFRCSLGVRCEQPINLTAHLALVKLFATSGTESIVPLETIQSVKAGDKIDVDARGEALLHFPDFLDIRIFRDSRLALSAESSTNPIAPAAYRLRLESGTIFNTVNSEQAGGKRVVVSTQWAEIQHIGTTFLVNYDPQTQRTWVVTVQGAVELSSTDTNGTKKLVTVPAGWQSWVDPRQPPAPPVPATRPAVGTLFPPIDQLTNGAIPDGAVLAQATAATTATFTPTATATPTSTATLTPTPTSIPATTDVSPPAPPIDTPTDTATPSDTPTATATVTATDTPTGTPTNTPTPGPDSIRNLRVKVLSSSEVELTVDYTYGSAQGDSVYIGAQPGENPEWFGYRPQQMVRGDGTATIIVTFGYNNAPPATSTSSMNIYMYIGGYTEFYSQQFAYPLRWSLGSSVTNTPTPTETPAAVQLNLAALGNSLSVATPTCTGTITATAADPTADCTYQVEFGIGAVSNTNTTVSFDILVQIDPINLSKTVSVDANLAAGQPYVTSVPVDLGTGPNCYYSTCHIRVTLDPNGVVPETDENDNVIERDVTWRQFTN